ncbi:MAG: cysteine hydrolase [Chloroflexi bacterium]|nr:cysteine hydrolase [Chloroflexota bacterium]
MNADSVIEDLKKIVHPSRTLVVVIDMQNDFCASGGALDRACESKPDEDLTLVQTMAPVLQCFLDEARRSGVGVAYVQMLAERRPGAFYAEICGRIKLAEHCLPGTWGADFYPPTAPREGDKRFTKHRYSAFTNPDFPTYLRMNRIDTLVVTGVGTPVCVESTVRDAFMADFNVVVPGDCVATYSRELHQNSLRIMARNFATVVDSAEIVKAWQSRSS